MTGSSIRVSGCPIHYISLNLGWFANSWLAVKGSGKVIKGSIRDSIDGRWRSRRKRKSSNRAGWGQ